MKTILTAFLFLFIASSAIAAGIDGNWIAKMSGPNGDEMEITFVFKVDGEKLTGSVKSPNGDVPISNGKIDGKRFSFDVSFNDMVIKHDCTMKEDDTIGMKVVGTPMGDSELILKRKQ